MNNGLNILLTGIDQWCHTRSRKNSTTTTRASTPRLKMNMAEMLDSTSSSMMKATALMITTTNGRAIEVLKTATTDGRTTEVIKTAITSYKH
jgi:hypothetical protein